MWPFRKKGEVVAKIEKLDDTLSVSFSHVKQDISKMNSWLGWLYNQHIEQQKTINILQERISSAHISPEQIRSMVEAHLPTEEITGRIMHVERKINEVASSIHSTEPLLKKVADLNSEVKLLEENQKPIMDRLRSIADKVEKMGQARPRNISNLREKIMKKVAQRSQDYIKNLILSTIQRYDKVSALQLREMIVEEQRLCSKSSFYRFLTDLENHSDVEVVVSGKEKIYIPKLIKKETVK
jgi:hypothetical protein